MMILEYIYGKWISLPSKARYLLHVGIITSLIYFFISLFTVLQLNIKAINPLTRSLIDYEITDMVFAKFRDRSIVNFNKDIIIVNTGKPNRAEIISALSLLNSFDTKAVGIDILFSERKDESQDDKLRKVIRQSDNLVLATVLGQYDDGTNLFTVPEGCHPYFCDSIPTGFINFVAKPETTVRLFSAAEKTDDIGEIAFAARVAQLANPDKTQILLNRRNKTERINYTGNDESYVQYEIAQLLEGGSNLKEVFKDKIVLFGYKGNDEWSQSTRDKFYTPLNEKVAVKSLPDMYGVMIHANIISMIMNESYITELPDWLNKVLAILIIFLSVAIIRMDFISYQNTYWIFIKLLQVMVFLVLFYLVAGFFYFLNIRLNLTSGLFGVFIAWDVTDFYQNLILPRVKSLLAKKLQLHNSFTPKNSKL